jgi:NAD(P)H-hydrate epimerase
MEEFNIKLLKNLYIPASNSKKGENGKMLIIGGSDLFHSPAFWAFEVASKIVDMVYFASTPMNNEILKSLKSKFINGIIVPRGRVFDYIEEADSILIGPGLPRDDGLGEEEESTKIITDTLLSRYPNKKWVVDGGSLQVIKPKILPKYSIITPNKKEFKMLFDILPTEENVKKLAIKFGITILVKGEEDYVSNGKKTIEISGGNAGMTKGGTGDILAGLTTAIYTKNEPFLSAACASFINKKAGESLEKRVGLYFNASDLVAEIPKIMKKYI